MANYFDQFDSAKPESGGGNFFDQFDKPEKDPGYVGEAIRGAKAGLKVQLPKMAGQALQFFGAEETGKQLVEGAEARNTPDLQESAAGQANDSPWSVRGNIYEAATNAVPSLAPGAAGAAAGAALGSIIPGAGTAMGALVGYAVGSIAALPMFYGSQAKESYDAVKKTQLEDGKSEAEADSIATKTAHAEGAIEAGGEVLADVIPFAKLFKPVARPVAKAAGTLVMDALVPTFKQGAKTAGGVVGAEVGTEMAQQAGEDYVRKEMGGTGEGATWHETSKVIMPTAIMSAIPGMAGAGARHLQRKAAVSALVDPETDPETRSKIAMGVSAAIQEADPTLARNFAAYAARQIHNDEPIEIGKDTLYADQQKLLPAPGPIVPAAPADNSADVAAAEANANKVYGERNAHEARQALLTNIAQAQQAAEKTQEALQAGTLDDAIESAKDAISSINVPEQVANDMRLAHNGRMLLERMEKQAGEDAAYAERQSQAVARDAELAKLNEDDRTRTQRSILADMVAKGQGDGPIAMALRQALGVKENENAIPVEGAGESGVQRSAGQGNAVQGEAVGGGNAQPVQVAGAQVEGPDRQANEVSAKIPTTPEEAKAATPEHLEAARNLTRSEATKAVIDAELARRAMPEAGTNVLPASTPAQAQATATAVPPTATAVTTGQFDSEAWNKAREDRIKASKESGAKHLDQIPAYVETMRGREIFNVHDPKERGVVRTVANTGEVVVNWSDEYSAKKNLATEREEKVGRGKPRKVFQTWLMPSDLKDYVVGKPAPVAPATQAQTQPSTVEQAQSDLAPNISGAKLFGQPISEATPKQLQAALKHRLERVRVAAQQELDRRTVKIPEGDHELMPAKRQQLFVERGNQRIEVTSLEDAARKWGQFFHEAVRQGAGSESVGGAKVVDQDGKEVARISQNGRVWPHGEWKSGTKPLLEAVPAESATKGSIKEVGERPAIAEAISANTSSSSDELARAFKEYDEPQGNGITVRDLLDKVEALIDEGLAPESLREPAEAYREALREDAEEHAGRGDVEPYADAFVDAVMEIVEGRRPKLALSAQTEQDLKAKEQQAVEGKVEERTAAVRDRNDAILTPPSGTAPPRDVAEQKVPTSQRNLFAASSSHSRPEQEPQITQPAPSEKIGDFGEKIGGARKDVWSSFKDKMTEAMGVDVAAQPLSKSWPEPDYQALLDAGADPWAVAFMHAARDEVPAKPKVSWKLKRWVEQVKTLRDFAIDLAEGKLSVARAKEELSKMASISRGMGMGHMESRIELYEMVGHAKSLSGVRVSVGHYSIFEGKEYKPPKTVWSVEKDVAATALSNWPRMLATGATKQEAMAQFKERYASLVIQQPVDREVSFDIFSKRNENGYWIGKKIGRNPALLAGPFNNIKEARAYKDEKHAELVAKLAKYKEIPQVRRDTNEPRVGEDMRNGQDVTPQMFSETFGFHGVEFGNWVEQGKRQKDLNEAFDALMDMAAILGVPPRTLSLNGELSLAFGARGAGGIDAAAAHYERDKVVINITKLRGAGSLGHEWWHALDNYFSRMRSKKDDYSTEALDVKLASKGSNYVHQGQVRKEMIDAFGQVVRAINETSMRARASKLDSRRGKDYWTTGREMSARAYESYLISKLQDQNASNDYLANIVDEATWKAAESMGFELGESYPYPTAGEVPKIRAAFDNFFKVIDKRETDKGVALFSRKQAYIESPSGAPLLAFRNVKLAGGNAMPSMFSFAGGKPFFYDVVRGAKKVGELSLNWKDGKVRDLLYIETDESERGQGIAEEVVSGIIQHNDGAPFRAVNVQPAARGFWQKMGAEFVDTGEGEDGIISEGAYERARSARQDARGSERTPEGNEGPTSFAKGAGRPEAVGRGREEAGLTPQSVRAAVDPIVAKWRNAPQVEVIGSMADAPKEVREADEGQKSGGAEGTPEGFYWRGKVYLVAEALKTNEDAIRTLFHESLGHAGLRGVFGDKLDTILDQIATDAPERVKRKAESYGLDFSNAEDRRQAAEEVLAEIAQTRPQSGIVRRAIAVIREFLREIGIDLKLSDNDIIAQFILPARDFIERGAEAQGAMAPAFSRTEELSKAENATLKALDSERWRATAIVGNYGVLRGLQEKGLVEARPSTGVLGGNSMEWRLTKEAPAKASPDQGTLFSRGVHVGTLTADQEQALRNVHGDPVTWKTKLDAFKKDWKKSLVQGVFDQFSPIAGYSQKAHRLAVMSKGGDSTLEALLVYGKVYVDKDGAYRVDYSRKGGLQGFAKVIAGLHGEQDRFLEWVAAHRAERLKSIGLENLYSDKDIAALKTLSHGTMKDGTARGAAYAKALKDLNEFNDSVLKIAVDSGLISEETRQMYKDLPYVPFYRLQDEGVVTGFGMKAGLVNQQAWKKLKGGTSHLNDDLLANLLQNWSHMITASAKNRAAKATLEAAVRAKVAEEVPSGTPGKGLVGFSENGKERVFRVSDQHLFDAIAAMDYAGLGPIAKPFIAMKRALTIGVTINPAFKIRNLIRDSIQAIGTAELSYNPLKNVAQGFKATEEESETRAQLLASGGMIRFGSMLDGNNADRTRRLVERGVNPEYILDDAGKIERFWKERVLPAFEAYQEFGDRGEQISRAALYEQLTKKGMSHEEAAFWARDLLDFQRSGKWGAVRILTQVVPFMNARLQGMYKLGRASKADYKRMGATLGAVGLASVALLLAYGDDDDWKKRPDWDRENNWWFKIGGVAFRIPKPFEIGAVGTLAERGAEYFLSNEMTGKRLAERLSATVFNQLSMNPTPQLVKPLMDIYANKDAFTGRPIESMGMDRLRKQERYTAGTSEVAKFLGALGLPDPTQLAMGQWNTLSPVQIESLARGYFGWLATMTTTALDWGIRPALDRGQRPDMKLRDVFLAGNFVETLPANSSRYIDQLYEQATAIEQAYGSYHEALKRGEFERAQSIRESEADKIRQYHQVETIKRRESLLNIQAKRIEASKDIPGDEKRRRLDLIEQRKSALAATLH